jgi:hypothetical protein
MAQSDNPVSLIAAMKDFFEAGGGPKIAIKEIQALSPDDRDYFRSGLKAVGYNIAPAA